MGGIIELEGIPREIVFGLRISTVRVSPRISEISAVFLGSYISTQFFSLHRPALLILLSSVICAFESWSPLSSEAESILLAHDIPLEAIVVCRVSTGVANWPFPLRARKRASCR